MRRRPTAAALALVLGTWLSVPRTAHACSANRCGSPPRTIPTDGAVDVPLNAELELLGPDDYFTLLRRPTQPSLRVAARRSRSRSSRRVPRGACASSEAWRRTRRTSCSGPRSTPSARARLPTWCSPRSPPARRKTRRRPRGRSRRPAPASWTPIPHPRVAVTWRQPCKRRGSRPTTARSRSPTRSARPTAPGSPASTASRRRSSRCPASPRS